MGQGEEGAPARAGSGGLTQSGETLLAPLREEFRERARLPFTQNLDIRVASLGRQAGVIGAAALCLQGQEQAKREQDD